MNKINKKPVEEGKLSEKQKSEQSNWIAENKERVKLWSRDVYLFMDQAIKVLPAEPIDILKGKKIKYTNPKTGETENIMLFDKNGRIAYHKDYDIYKAKYFKNQSVKEFKKVAKSLPEIILNEGTDDEKHIKVMYLTWHQTLEVEAYQQALNTFDKGEDYDLKQRQITISSGNGCGKTSFASIVSLHFLITQALCQIGVTANTGDQLKDIFFKEFYKWEKRLPAELSRNLVQLEKKIIVDEDKEWFLRGRVAGKDNPEALSGLHGDAVLLFIDEASGVMEETFSHMQGALTGENWIIIMTSNPTQLLGYFANSHREGAPWTQLHLDSEYSPIVNQPFVDRILLDNPTELEDSEDYRIFVNGKFPKSDTEDDQGWIPLFQNVNIQFEEPIGQVIKNGIMGVDPAGNGKDKTEIVARDNMYMRNIFTEKTSTPKTIARMVETLRDGMDILDENIVLDAFGVGAEAVNEYRPAQIGHRPVALLTSEPVYSENTKRPEQKRRKVFNSLRSKLAWDFRKWLSAGGVIITRNPEKWRRTLEKMKYKRNGDVISLMNKVEFKKIYGHSPDLIDASFYTFYYDEPITKYELSSAEREEIEEQKLMGQFDAEYSTQYDDGNSSV